MRPVQRRKRSRPRGFPVRPCPARLRANLGLLRHIGRGIYTHDKKNGDSDFFDTVKGGRWEIFPVYKKGRSFWTPKAVTRISPHGKGR
jgi:hypothetical protein